MPSRFLIGSLWTLIQCYSCMAAHFYIRSKKIESFSIMAHLWVGWGQSPTSWSWPSGSLRCHRSKRTCTGSITYRTEIPTGGSILDSTTTYIKAGGKIFPCLKRGWFHRRDFFGKQNALKDSPFRYLWSLASGTWNGQSKGGRISGDGWTGGGSE